MFSVHETSRPNYYKYLAKLNFEAARGADKAVGGWPGYEVTAPPPVMTLCAPTGSDNGTGYLKVTVQPGQTVFVHRLAWFMHTGEDPLDMQVDHENGDRSDNRWSNLRLVTNQENGKNRKMSSKNKTGVHGVQVSRAGNYVAFIGVDMGQQFLGTFYSLEDAANARREAEDILGFHENHGRAA